MSDPDLDLADAALDTALAMLRWKARALKAEAALLEVVALCDYWSAADGDAIMCNMGDIARAALEGE
jgi:hypothetical protein